MRLLEKLFSKRRENEEPDDVMQISRVIGALIDRTVMEVFSNFRSELVNSSIAYIVPAVWGATRDGELTETQKEIHKQVGPVIDEIIDEFGFDQLTKAQEIAIGFIVRGLIISKITYMIEAFKNMTRDAASSEQKDYRSLEEIDPIGNA